MWVFFQRKWECCECAVDGGVRAQRATKVRDNRLSSARCAAAIQRPPLPFSCHGLSTPRAASHFSSIPLFHCRHRRLLHSILYRQAFIISELPWDNAVVGFRFGNMKWAPILAHRTQFIWAYFQNSNYACEILKSSQFFTDFLWTWNKNSFLQNVDKLVGFQLRLFSSWRVYSLNILVLGSQRRFFGKDSPLFLIIYGRANFYKICKPVNGFLDLFLLRVYKERYVSAGCPIMEFPHLLC